MIFGIDSKKVSYASIVWMGITTIVVFLPNVSPWIATPFVVIGSLLMLGVLLAVCLGIRSDDASVYMLYSIGLGLSYLMLGSLVFNWIMPYFGVLEPLARLPIMIFIDFSVLALSASVYFFHKDFAPSWKFSLPDRINLIFGLLPWIFPVMGMCGAEILNNGGSGALTLTMLFLIAIYVLVIGLIYRRIGNWTFISALYAISLSLLLMYSLRSSHIFGWDINLEYQVFQTTLKNLRWQMSYYPGLDYNACLSITILPTILKVLTNTPSEYVFKFTSQLFFAVVPVGVYIFSKRYLSTVFSFFTGFLFLSQTWFFEQMPALVRQEMAFVFCILLLIVLFDDHLTARMKSLLFSVFTAALIISHYSTAYVWIALFAIVSASSYLFRFFFAFPRDRRFKFHMLMLAVSFALLFVWQVPVTQTIGKLANFVTNNNGQTAEASTTPAAPIASVVSSSSVGYTPPSTLASIFVVFRNVAMMTLFSGYNPNNDQNLLAAEQAALVAARRQVGYETYPAAAFAGYAVSTINNSVQIAPRLPSAFSLLINLIGKILKILLIDLFPIIGIAGLYFGLRRRPENESYDFILFGVGAYGLIVLTVLVPYIQEYYNLTRLYLQMFLVLSTFAVLGLVMAVKYFSRYQMLIMAGIFVFLFCYLNGAFDQLTGGQARMTLDQPPANLDQPYTSDMEVAGAQWLANNRDPRQPIQADIVASLRLQGFANIDDFNNSIFPATIERNSYVYLVGENIIQKSAFYQYRNNLLVYQYPIVLLNDHKNLIFNDGGSRVYR